VAAENYMDLPAAAPGERITALAEYGGYVVAFSSRSAYRVGTEFEVVTAPLVAGPLNDRCLISWTNRQLLCLGSDLNIYSLELPNSGADAQAAPFSKALLPDAALYLRQFAHPENISLWASTRPDYARNLWWIYLRGRCGRMLAFCLHLVPEEGVRLTGPFTSAPLAASTLSDGRALAQDQAGNLLWEPADLPMDALSDTLPATGALPLTDGTEIPSRTIDGEVIARLTVPDGEGGTVGRYLRRARFALWRSPWMPAAPGAKICARDLLLRLWPNASGLVYVVVRNERGVVVHRSFGEVSATCLQRQLLITGTALQMSLLVLTGGAALAAFRSHSINLTLNGKN
jgi:hypothetical protein